MAKPTHISSSAQFQKLVSSNTCVVVDFYADWCGPCKAIAPTFDALCASESKAGKMAFCKVDVDSQQDIARTYSVSAMPTFIILFKGSVRETIRGANPSALRSAVTSASTAAAGTSGGGSSASFSSKGHVLGSEGSGSSSSKASSTAAAAAAAGDLSSWMPSIPGGALGTVTRFVGLYLTTLFSLDPRLAAEQSPYRADGPRRY